MRVGDKIRFLIDRPFYASTVRRGDVGTIVRIDNPNSFIYVIASIGISEWAAETNSLGIVWEYLNNSETKLGAAIQTVVSNQPHKCSCVFRDLLMNGCVCGGI